MSNKILTSFLFSYLHYYCNHHYKLQ